MSMLFYSLLTGSSKNENIPSLDNQKMEENCYNNAFFGLLVEKLAK